jgi:hypothetical protein
MPFIARERARAARLPVLAKTKCFRLLAVDSQPKAGRALNCGSTRGGRMPATERGRAETRLPALRPRHSRLAPVAFRGGSRSWP